MTGRACSPRCSTKAVNANKSLGAASGTVGLAYCTWKHCVVVCFLCGEQRCRTVLVWSSLIVKVRRDFVLEELESTVGDFKLDDC